MTEVTDKQRQHVDVMRLVARQFSDTPMVLKGGTALLLGYGLDRHSEDLDFDSTKLISVKSRIENAFKATPLALERIDTRKDTSTTHRVMIRYSGPAGAGSLKLEVSLRNSEIDPSTTTNIDGIQIYKVSSLISQKLNAAEGRSKIRDIYDLAFLSREYPDEFTDKQAERLAHFMTDPDEVLEKFAPDHQEDSILSSIDLEDLVLQIDQSIEELNDTMRNKPSL